MSINRRDFLKGALAGGALLAVESPAEARPNKTISPDALGLLYDSTLCIGCKACVSACKEENGMPPEYSSTEEQYWDTPLDISGKTLNVIKLYNDGTAEYKDSEKNGYAFMKISCLHCVDPSCVSACPVSAMTKDAVTGIVGYDKDICIGCRYCVGACPFGVPRFQYDTPIPKISKCQLCRHRPEGKYSACAEVCPTGATLYGKTSDLMIEAKRRLALKPGDKTVFPRGNLNTHDQSPHTANAANYVQQIYGDKELGGTQMLKLSAVPFEKLGMPKLPERSFASVSETIQHTLYKGLIAPLAFLGILSYVAKRNVDDEKDEG